MIRKRAIFIYKGGTYCIYAYWQKLAAKIFFRIVKLVTALPGFYEL